MVELTVNHRQLGSTEETDLEAQDVAVPSRLCAKGGQPILEGTTSKELERT